MTTAPSPSFPAIRRWQVAMVAGCNLRCRYCATRHGTYGSTAGVMGEEVAERLAGLIAACLPKDSPGVKVSFGGGETLVHFDRFLALADRITEQCARRGGRASFGLTTNGTLLDEGRARELIRRRVALVFSIDGPARVHDAMRRDAAGAGSFASAFHNWLRYRELAKAEPERIPCSIHSVYGPHTESLAELSSFWVEHGVPVVDVGLASVSRFDALAEAETTRQARTAFLGQLRQFALAKAAQYEQEDFLERFSGPSMLYQGWRRLLLGESKPLCKPGKRLLAADHTGGLFPCEGYLGVEQWRLGDVWAGPQPDRLAAYATERSRAEALCARCPRETVCDKPCIALDPLVSPAQSLAKECAYAGEVTDILTESYARLMGEGIPVPACDESA